MIKIGNLEFKIEESNAVVKRFYNYTKEVVIPSQIEYEGKEYNVTKIGEMAFAYCEKLKTINIPKSVKEIGKNAFLECTQLNYTIPEGVTYIE